MSFDAQWYRAELHPRSWAGRPDDHPWLVEARQRYEAARIAGDEDARLDVAWWLGSLVGRAVGEQLQIGFASDDPPDKWIEESLATIEQGLDRFPGRGDTMPPQLELRNLAKAMGWVDRIRSTERTTALEESPFNGIWHLWSGIVNPAFQLVAAMAPARPKPARRVPAETWNRIHETTVALLAEVDAAAFMGRVIDKCEELISARWDEFRDLPFSHDVDAVVARFVQALEGAPPPPEVQALWFGLFNPKRDGLTTADVYFGGATEFDPADPDWPTELSYEPPGGYLQSEVLSAIYEIAYRKTDLGNDAEYPLCLAYGASVARACGRAYAERFDTRVWVTSGFDSGDTIDVGWVEPH
ncbi:MAG TPA: hypothetical protein VIG64_12755 [Actinomycetota bacterium]|jgi:hypothetical protein